MGEQDIDNLYSKMNSMAVQIAEQRIEISHVRCDVAEIKSKLDRAQWWSFTQAVAVAVALLLLIIGWVRP